MAKATPVFRIDCATQSYDWGKIGLASKVAQFAQAAGVAVSPEKPYAELWMGTHPSGPSHVHGNGGDALLQVLQRHPELLGEHTAKCFGSNDLPFLFKVLSIQKALSIQAHPDKKLGAELHAKFPTIYKDPNHKPEMAIALTPFEGLCGFRPLVEIAAHLRAYPELMEAVGKEIGEAFVAFVAANAAQAAVASKNQTDAVFLEQSKAHLRALFQHLMHRSAEDIARLISQLVARLSASLSSSSSSSSFLDALVLRLNEQFPGDVGIFSAFLLNYMSIGPGEAFFMGANEPHAYLSGDCIECMAASDNVVRAGLTPKLKDVPVLVSMLTYDYGPSNDRVMRGDAAAGHANTLIYDPPIEEFSVARIQLATDTAETWHCAGPSIMIVTEGSGKIETAGFSLAIEAGLVYFIAANTNVRLTAAEGKALTAYVAYSD